MHNRQWAILIKLYDIINKSELVVSTGYYPDDISNIATYPAVLLMDGDESNYQCMTGNQVTFDYYVTLMLLLDVKEGTRIQDILELQNQIQTLVAQAEDLFSNVGAAWIKMVSVRKGDASNIAGMDALGYLPNLTVRMIDFSFGIDDDNN